MNPLALVGFVGIGLIILGVLWFVFSSKKEQAHIKSEVSENLDTLAAKTAPASTALRADIAADIAAVQAHKAEDAAGPVV